MRFAGWCTVLACLLSVTAGAAETPDTPIFVQLPVYEGATKVKGKTSATKVRLVVRSGWKRAEDTRDTPTTEIPPIEVSGGEFTFTLDSPLTAGDQVKVMAVESNGERTFEVASVIMDFGRLRGYFSIGGTVAQSRSNFSSTDTFIGLTTDARIAGRLIEKPTATRQDLPAGTKKGEAGPSSAQAVPTGSETASTPDRLELRNVRYQLNAIVDARVGVQFQTSGSGAATATGGTPAAQPFQRPDQLQYSWDQPGFLQIGLHAPLSFKGMDWHSDGKLFSFFFGPLVKAGVQAYDAPIVVSRTVAIDLTKAETDTSRYKTIFEDDRSGALPFFALGTRLGIYGYDLLGQTMKNRQVSNDPVAYVDLTVGRAAGFRSYSFTHGENDAHTVETVSITSRKDRRLSAEGRLKIPRVPALVGFDVNLHWLLDDETPNDFRFIVAFRMDAQKALAKVFGGAATGHD